MGVSVVMGGVRMMDGDGVEEVRVAESTRVLKSTKSVVLRDVVEGRKTGRILSEDEIIAKLMDLDEKPRNVIQQTVIEDLLKRIPAERVFPFLDRCHGELSIVLEEKVFEDLVALAVNDFREEAMDQVLARGWFWRIRELSSNLSVGRRGLADGGDGGPSWVGDFSKRRRGRSIFNLRYTAGEEYLADYGTYQWRAMGDEGLARFAENFSESRQVMMWKNFLTREGRYGDLFPAEMAERLVRFSDEGIYGELKEVVWLHWLQMARSLLTEGLSWDETLEEYQKKLPEKYADDFQRACRDAVKPLVTKDENE